MLMAQNTTTTPSLLPRKLKPKAQGWARMRARTAKGSEHNCPFLSATNSFLSWIQGPVIQEKQTSDPHD